ncbi:MAG TPA: hypothetical protein VFX59_05585 [Polyangiales bacterium]|nr:hypothetical protein [Polyangiales bacterium]
MIAMQVPFLRELDEVRALPILLTQLARGMLSEQRVAWVRDDPDASACSARSSTCSSSYCCRACASTHGCTITN